MNRYLKMICFKKSSIKKQFILTTFITVILFVFLVCPIQAKVTATVNKTIINSNEPLRLVIESTEGGSPDLSVLTDFTILQRGQSQQMSCINGTCESKQEWVYILSPLKSDQTLVIPAISVGQSQTAPIQIQLDQNTVSHSTQNQYADADKVQVRYQLNNQKEFTINQTILFDLNILIPERLVSSIKSMGLEFTQSDKINFEKINKHFQEQWISQNGKRYLSLDVPLQLTLIQSGEVELKPILFKFEGQQNWTPFSDSVPSNSIALMVKPKPQDYPADAPFYPAQDLTLKAAWSTNQSQIKEGESITQTVTLAAQGLTTQQLSLPSLPEIQNVKTYLGDKKSTPSWIENQTINGQIQSTTTFVATKTGSITIPEQKLPWWNTKTQQLEYATIPARTFEVVANPVLQSQNDEQSQQELNSNDSFTEQNTPFLPTLPTWVKWLFALIALFISWLIYKLITKPKKITDSETTKQKTHLEPTCLKTASELDRLLKQACLNNQAKKAKDVLDHLIKQNLFSLPEALKNQEFKNAYHDFNQALYGPEHIKWDGQLFWNAFINLGKKSKKQKHHDDELPPIYPD